MTEQRLYRIAGFALVTADLPRLVGFYRDELGFDTGYGAQPIEQAEMSILGLSGAGRRQVVTLGTQALSIDQFEQAGRSYPAGSDAASLWFQHLALVVTDIDEAYSRLRGFSPVSEGGPQQLPASSGGIMAFKFRDPDGHLLEFLQFPEAKIPDKWKSRQTSAGQIGLGIDHSAISVADVNVSSAFYRSLGLQPGERTFNHGPAQQRLDDLRDVEVEVVPMIPPDGMPHLELLAYQVMQRGCGTTLAANDIAATRIIWHGNHPKLVRDPDGHLQQIIT